MVNLDNFGTMCSKNLLSLLPSRLLQVWQQLNPCPGPVWWAYRIRAAKWSRSPDRWASRTEDSAPTTSPDISSQAWAAWCRSSHWTSTAASSPGTRHGNGHGHGAEPGQARADGTSRWAHGANQADRSSRNYNAHHGEYKDEGK